MKFLMTPAGPDGLQKALLPLMLSTVMPNMDGLSDKSQQAYFAAKVGEYSRLLEHIPVDILRSACDAHVRRSKFFPAIAEIMEFAEPAFALRQRQAKRLEALMKSGGKPTAPAFVPEAAHVRLFAVLKWQEKPGSHLYNPTKAAATRRELQRCVDKELDEAATQGREPAAWTVGNERINLLFRWW